MKYRVTVPEAFYGEGDKGALVRFGDIVEGPAGLKYPWLAPAEAPKGAAEKRTEKTEIKIDGWREMHHAQQVKLAKQLEGDFVVPDGKTETDVARELLQAEETRRAGTRG